MHGPWVLGGERPMTHAFMVVELDGWLWRLDGQPGGADWSPCAGFSVLAHPSKVWEIIAAPEERETVLLAARRMDGRPYGWDQIAGQAVRAFSAMLRRLGWRTRLRLVGLDGLLARPAICTRVVQECLKSVRAAKPDLDAMATLFPEHLAQVLRRAEGRWTTCVW